MMSSTNRPVFRSDRPPVGRIGRTAAALAAFDVFRPVAFHPGRHQEVGRDRIPAARGRLGNALRERRHGSDDDRFSLYQPIREVIAARQDAAATRHWRHRLRAWALLWARSLPRTPPLAAVRAEMPNLLAALASAVDDDAAAEAIELLLALRRCVEEVELPAEGLLHAQAALEACTDPLLKARGHSLLGSMLFTAGQGAAALRHAELGVVCPGLDSNQRARALFSLARVRWRTRRQAAEVEPLLQEADSLAATGADLDLRASLSAQRAFVTIAHHHDQLAGERLHVQALDLWQQAGNQHAINSGRYNLAVCAQNANRHRDAVVQLQPIIASSFDEQDWRRLSQSLNVRGNAYSGLRQWSLAVADYQQCVRIAWKGMASFDLAYGLWNVWQHGKIPMGAGLLIQLAVVVFLFGLISEQIAMSFSAATPRPFSPGDGSSSPEAPPQERR